jgi:hypothetical protein
MGWGPNVIEVLLDEKTNELLVKGNSIPTIDDILATVITIAREDGSNPQTAQADTLTDWTARFAPDNHYADYVPMRTYGLQIRTGPDGGDPIRMTTWAQTLVIGAGPPQKT